MKFCFCGFVIRLLYLLQRRTGFVQTLFSFPRDDDQTGLMSETRTDGFPVGLHLSGHPVLGISP